MICGCICRFPVRKKIETDNLKCYKDDLNTKNLVFIFVSMVTMATDQSNVYTV